MARINHKKRYFGMTTSQIGILASLFLMFCLIFSSGVFVFLNPSAIENVFIAIQPSTVASVPQPTPANTLQSTEISPSPTATTMPTPTVEVAQIVPLETLDSYRLQGQITANVVKQPGPPVVFLKFMQEWDRKSQSQHIIETLDMPMPGTATSVAAQDPLISQETIIVGDTYWIKTMENEWMQIIPPQPGNQLNSLVNLPTEWSSIKLISEEIVLNIHCTRYTVDEDITKVSDQNGTTMTTHAQGDIWIASQPDVPPVMMRVRIQMQGSGTWFYPLMDTPILSPGAQAAGGVIYSLEYEITDINVPIIIEPPQTTNEQ